MRLSLAANVDGVDLSNIHTLKSFCDSVGDFNLVSVLSYLKGVFLIG